MVVGQGLRARVEERLLNAHGTRTFRNWTLVTVAKLCECTKKGPEIGTIQTEATVDGGGGEPSLLTSRTFLFFEAQEPPGL